MSFTELPKEIKEAVVYSARNWPKSCTAQQLLNELNALATRVYLLLTVYKDKGLSLGDDNDLAEGK